MKAARYYGPGDIRIEQIPEPEPKEGQVKIKVAWNGICGSDLHAYLTTLPVFPTFTKPNELTGETLPVTLGHEFSGTIVSIGSGVDEEIFKIGQNAIVEPAFSCLKNSCNYCATGATNVCPKLNFIGIGGWGGGLSEYIAVNTRQVHILPESIPLEIGAMIEPLAVCWHAVQRSGFKDGQSVLVVGAGPIGLFLVKVLRSFGPSSTIIVSEPALIRRELASKHGADVLINPLASSSSSPVPTAVLNATSNVGVDVAFDAAGTQAGLDSALLSVRPHGTFVNVALWEEHPRVNMTLILHREITFTGSSVYAGIHPEVIEAVAASRITGIEELITRKIAIEDVMERGFLALLKEKDKQVKILVHP